MPASSLMRLASVSFARKTGRARLKRPLRGGRPGGMRPPAWVRTPDGLRTRDASAAPALASLSW